MTARSRAASAGIVALAAALWVTGVTGGVGAAALSAAPAVPGSWPVYHQNPAGTGVAPSVTAVSTGTRAWTSLALDGDIYGEPLVFAKRGYVATENDTVYALLSATGGRGWAEHPRPPPAPGP